MGVPVEKSDPIGGAVLELAGAVPTAAAAGGAVPVLDPGKTDGGGTFTWMPTTFRSGQ